MLDMGFIPDVKRVLALLPAKRQNLLFSATFSDEIKALADKLLDDPQTIEVTPRNSTVEADRPARASGRPRRARRALLAYLVSHNRWEQVLVFTRTKHGADKLVRSLEADGIRAVALHGNKSQGARTRALADFKAGERRRCWSRPTSPRAASTSTSFRTWSTTTCRTCPRTTCIASAAPAAPATTARRSRWCASTSTRSCATSSA